MDWLASWVLPRRLTTWLLLAAACTALAVWWVQSSRAAEARAAAARARALARASQWPPPAAVQRAATARHRDTPLLLCLLVPPGRRSVEAAARTLVSAFRRAAVWHRVSAAVYECVHAREDDIGACRTSAVLARARTLAGGAAARALEDKTDVCVAPTAARGWLGALAYLVDTQRKGQEFVALVAPGIALRVGWDELLLHTWYMTRGVVVAAPSAHPAVLLPKSETAVADDAEDHDDGEEDAAVATHTKDVVDAPPLPGTGNLLVTAVRWLQSTLAAGKKGQAREKQHEEEDSTATAAAAAAVLPSRQYTELGTFTHAIGFHPKWNVPLVEAVPLLHLGPPTPLLYWKHTLTLLAWSAVRALLDDARRGAAWAADAVVDADIVGNVALRRWWMRELHAREQQAAAVLRALAAPAASENSEATPTAAAVPDQLQPLAAGLDPSPLRVSGSEDDDTTPATADTRTDFLAGATPMATPWTSPAAAPGVVHSPCFAPSEAVGHWRALPGAPHRPDSHHAQHGRRAWPHTSFRGLFGDDAEAATQQDEGGQPLDDHAAGLAAAAHAYDTALEEWHATVLRARHLSRAEASERLLGVARDDLTDLLLLADVRRQPATLAPQATLGLVRVSPLQPVECAMKYQSAAEAERRLAALARPSSHT